MPKKPEKNIIKIINKNNIDRYKNIYCNNCGKKGHVYKMCIEPVISNGIICINRGESEGSNTALASKERKYLIIRRRDSYAYVEFIRGKYFMNNEEYIGRLISHMTKNEQNILKSGKTFKEIWENFWMCKSENMSKTRKNEFISSRKKFNQLIKVKTGTLQSSTLQSSTLQSSTLQSSILQKLINQNQSKYDEPEWGFPKGRRNMRENDINCAKREFMEETNFSENDFTILKTGIKLPLVETYIASNNIKYKNNYFLAESNKNILDSLMEDGNDFQHMEISAIKWATYKEAMKCFRDKDVAKKKVLTFLHKSPPGIL